MGQSQKVLLRTLLGPTMMISQGIAHQSHSLRMLHKYKKGEAGGGYMVLAPARDLTTRLEVLYWRECPDCWCSLFVPEGLCVPVTMHRTYLWHTLHN